MIEKVPRRAVDPSSDRVAATRARLLDAAEQAFLDHAYDEVSVRNINAAAGFNPGAAHYHFGSKEGLAIALVENRLARQTRFSSQKLEELEAEEHPEVEDVLGLSLDPLLELACGSAVEQLLVHLMATVLLRGSEVPFVSESFALDRWSKIVARAVPDVAPTTIHTRWEFVVTLLLQLTGRPLGRVPQERVDLDRDALITFLAAGIRAPE